MKNLSARQKNGVASRRLFMGIQALEAALFLKHEGQGERSYRSMRKDTRVTVQQKVWQVCCLKSCEIGNVLYQSARPRWKNITFTCPRSGGRRSRSKLPTRLVPGDALQMASPPCAHKACVLCEWRERGDPSLVSLLFPVGSGPQPGNCI